MPNEKRLESLQQIRNEFKKNAYEVDEDAVSEHLKKANSTLSFMKIITPKRSKEQSGSTKIIFGKDQSGVVTKKAVTNWHGGNMDPDSVSRHYNGLKRAGFYNNSHAKGLF